jgi:hypothetical protein
MRVLGCWGGCEGDPRDRPTITQTKRGKRGKERERERERQGGCFSTPESLSQCRPFSTPESLAPTPDAECSCYIHSHIMIFLLRFPSDPVSQSTSNA